MTEPAPANLSPDQLRARIADTLSELHQRLEPSQHLETLMSMITSIPEKALSATVDGISRSATSTAAAVRRHPGATVAVVGAAAVGAAFALFSRKRRMAATDSVFGPTKPIAQSAEKAFSHLKDRVSNAQHTAQEQFSDVIDSVAAGTKSTAKSLADATEEGLSLMKDQSRSYYRASAGFLDKATRYNPMVTLAASVAVGAALAAILPRTSREDAMTGRASDRLGHSARRVARKAMRAAKDAARQDPLSDDAKGSVLASAVGSIGNSIIAAGDAVSAAVGLTMPAKANR